MIGEVVKRSGINAKIKWGGEFLSTKMLGAVAFALFGSLAQATELDLAGTWKLTQADKPEVTCPGLDRIEDMSQNDMRGDMHYWQVWFGGRPFDNYYTVAQKLKDPSVLEVWAVNDHGAALTGDVEVRILTSVPITATCEPRKCRAG